MAQVTVEFTRSDLVALKETIEQTPLFEGRVDLRDAVNSELRRRGKPDPLRVEAFFLSQLAHRIIAVDPDSVRLRGKITRALRSNAHLA